jgi:membrane-anchored protein YejM (alkaline phosphatase superfamily)
MLMLQIFLASLEVNKLRFAFSNKRISNAEYVHSAFTSTSRGPHIIYVFFDCKLFVYIWSYKAKLNWYINKMLA